MNFRLLTAKEYPLCPIFSVCWRKDVTRYGDCLTEMSC